MVLCGSQVKYFVTLLSLIQFSNASSASSISNLRSLNLLVKILTVPLEAANTAVTAGDYIKVGATTIGCYDKGAANNHIAIALEGASANSGDSIAVLFL